MTNRTIRILLVEDNPGDVVLLREALSGSPERRFEITTTAYLNEALELLGKARFDIVLLDLSLPDSVGMETFTTLHSRFPHIPVVVVTGLLDEETGNRAVRSGAQDYLIKGSIGTDVLIRAIHYAIERRAAEEELHRINRALKVITACNEALVRTTGESELLTFICRTIVEVGGYRMAWVGYAQEDEGKSVRPVAQAGFEEGYLEAARITWADAPMGRGPTGRAIRTGEYHVCKDVQTDPNLQPWRERAVKLGFASSIAFPLLAEGKSFGALTIYASQPNAFTQQEIKLLSEMANDLAYGITSLRTRKERRKAEERILFTNSVLEFFIKKTTRKEYLESVLWTIKKWSGCQCAGIRLINQDDCVPYECYDGYSREFWEKENCLSLTHDQCVCTRAFTQIPDPSDTPYITPWGSFVCNDTQQLLQDLSLEAKKRYRGECIRSGFMTLAAIPIFYREQILGVLHLADYEHNKIPKDALDLMESMAPVIGEAVHRFNVEESLQKSNELLERMFSGIHLLIAYMDTEFNFIRVNRAYAEADGRTEEYFVGKNHFEMFPNPENERIFRHVVETGEPFFTFAKPFQYTEHPERGTMYWDWSLQPVKGINGKVIGVVLSLLNVTEQKRLEKETLEISQREQQRIGQDLHDVLGQNLTGVAFLAKVLSHKLNEKSLVEAQEAEKIAQLASQSVTQARALARGLCPVELESGGLTTALQEFAANMRNYFGIRCEFTCDHPIHFRDNTAAMHLYRIAQEAVNNAIKHGKAKEITITLACHKDGTAVLSVEDDGVGLPDATGISQGMGLRIMGYRARMIGGQFEARRGMRGGTLIACTLDGTMIQKEGGEATWEAEANQPKRRAKRKS